MENTLFLDIDAEYGHALFHCVTRASSPWVGCAHQISKYIACVAYGGFSPSYRARCIDLLKKYIQGLKEGLLIRSNHRYRMSRSNLNSLVARVAKRAGVLSLCPSRKHVSPHLFRHSFNRIALNEGMPVNELSAILGHNKISMTLDIYSRPSINQVQRSYERIFNNRGSRI